MAIFGAYASRFRASFTYQHRSRGFSCIETLLGFLDLLTRAGYRWIVLVTMFAAAENAIMVFQFRSLSRR